MYHLLNVIAVLVPRELFFLRYGHIFPNKNGRGSPPIASPLQAASLCGCVSWAEGGGKEKKIPPPPSFLLLPLRCLGPLY